MDPPSMAINNLFAKCQPDPTTFILAAANQAMEWQEDPVQMLFVEPNAMILNVKLDPTGDRLLSRNGNDGLLAWLMELERISDQILKKLVHLQRVCFYRHQLSDYNCPLCALDVDLQIRQHFSHHFV